jgi:uncharacterized membrane protein YdjX (TVP38/TMEM64 family)
VKKHAILTAIGLIVGLIALAWIQPLTSAGATLLLVLVLVVLNGIAALPVWGSHQHRRSPRKKKLSKEKA